jgi:hypothetical protein
MGTKGALAKVEGEGGAHQERGKVSQDAPTPQI